MQSNDFYCTPCILISITPRAFWFLLHPVHFLCNVLHSGNTGQWVVSECNRHRSHRGHASEGKGANFPRFHFQSGPSTTTATELLWHNFSVHFQEQNYHGAGRDGEDDDDSRDGDGRIDGDDYADADYDGDDDGEGDGTVMMMVGGDGDRNGDDDGWRWSNLGETDVRRAVRSGPRLCWQQDSTLSPYPRSRTATEPGLGKAPEP